MSTAEQSVEQALLNCQLENEKLKATIAHFHALPFEQVLATWKLNAEQLAWAREWKYQNITLKTYTQGWNRVTMPSRSL